MAGAVTLRIGRPASAEGDASRTIHHCLTAVRGVDAAHGHDERGPLANRAVSHSLRWTVAHRSPIKAKPQFRMRDVGRTEFGMYGISTGRRLRQAVPASREAMFYLTCYLDAADLPGPDEPLWRTRRGDFRPMSSWAMRRVLQCANEKLRTTWSLHDLA